jgi:hypothetical protein
MHPTDTPNPTEASSTETAPTTTPSSRTSLPRRRRSLVALAVALATLSLASVAGAGGAFIQSFTDVAPNHNFFDEIEQVAHACIAEGYPDGTYRPNEGVNRGSMAAFLSRAGGRIGSSFQQGGPSPSVGHPAAMTMTPWTTIASGNVALPSAGCERTVKVDGNTTLYMNNTVANSCHAVPCNVEIGLFVGNTQIASTFTRLSADYGAEAIALTGQHVTTDSLVSYSLRARAYNVKPGAAVFAARNVVGTFFPFQANINL